MKFKLEFTFDISDSSLLIDANDGRSEEYTSLEDVPEEFSAGCISLALVKEVLEKLGWTDTEDLETNGWDIDYWVTFIKEGKDFKYIVSGSLYYGNINIRKEKF